jgi:hypothetical protein
VIDLGRELPQEQGKELRILLRPEFKMPELKNLTSLGGDGGGAAGTGAALGTVTLSPLVEPAIRQMTTEVAQHALYFMSPEFQNNTGVLGSMAIMLLIGFFAAKMAHHSLR